MGLLQEAIGGLKSAAGWAKNKWVTTPATQMLSPVLGAAKEALPAGQGALSAGAGAATLAFGHEAQGRWMRALHGGVAMTGLALGGFAYAAQGETRKLIENMNTDPGGITPDHVPIRFLSAAPAALTGAGIGALGAAWGAGKRGMGKWGSLGMGVAGALVGAAGGYGAGQAVAAMDGAGDHIGKVAGGIALGGAALLGAAKLRPFAARRHAMMKTGASTSASEWFDKGSRKLLRKEAGTIPLEDAVKMPKGGIEQLEKQFFDPEAKFSELPDWMQSRLNKSFERHQQQYQKHFTPEKRGDAYRTAGALALGGATALGAGVMFDSLNANKAHFDLVMKMQNRNPRNNMEGYDVSQSMATGVSGPMLFSGGRGRGGYDLGVSGDLGLALNKLRRG